jgi:outer membrane immunogenic protein
MNKLVIGTVALAAIIAGPAMAADMPLKAPPPVPVYTWTGCYVGMQVGYGLGRAKATSTGTLNGLPNGTAGVDKTGWFNVYGELGGGEIGCNYQVGNWVWGIEIDGSWVAKDGQSNLLGPVFNPVFVDKLSERWLAMARGRIGYAVDKWLWYFTAGGAWAGFDVTEYSSANILLTAIERHSHGAWVVGIGTEYAVAYGWSVKWETLYMDFGKIHAFDSTLTGCCTAQDTRYQQWVSRFGLNYKFDWYSPVVAKY